MKALISAILIVILILSATIFIALFINKKLSNFNEKIDTSIQQHESASHLSYKIKEIESEYNKIRVYLLLFMHDDDIREIEEHISDIKSAAESDSVPELMAAKSRLMLHIEQLRRLTKFSIEAIF